MTQTRGLRPLDPIFDPNKRLGAISVGNSPGSGGGASAFPTFSWPGAANFTDLGPPWPVTADMSLVNFIIVMADGQAVLGIDILVGSSVVDSVTTASTRTQTLSIAVPVVVGDDIQLEITSIGAGTANNIGVVLTT